MAKCEIMETRRCPADACSELGCARFSRDEIEWTDDEHANVLKWFKETWPDKQPLEEGV